MTSFCSHANNQLIYQITRQLAQFKMHSKRFVYCLSVHPTCTFARNGKISYLSPLELPEMSISIFDDCRVGKVSSSKQNRLLPVDWNDIVVISFPSSVSTVGYDSSINTCKLIESMKFWMTDWPWLDNWTSNRLSSKAMAAICRTSFFITDSWLIEWFTKLKNTNTTERNMNWSEGKQLEVLWSKAECSFKTILI